MPINPNPFELLQHRLAAIEQRVAELERENMELQLATRPRIHDTTRVGE